MRRVSETSALATSHSVRQKICGPLLSQQIRTLLRPSSSSPSEEKGDEQTEFQSKTDLQLPSNLLQKKMLKIKPGPKKLCIGVCDGRVFHGQTCGTQKLHGKKGPREDPSGADTHPPPPLPRRWVDGGPRPRRDVGQPLHVPRGALAETGLGTGHRGHPDCALSTSTTPLPGGDPKGSNVGRSLQGPTNPTLSPLRREVQRGGQTKCKQRLFNSNLFLKIINVNGDGWIRGGKWRFYGALGGTAGGRRWCGRWGRRGRSPRRPPWGEPHAPEGKERGRGCGCWGGIGGKGPGHSHPPPSMRTGGGTGS